MTLCRPPVQVVQIEVPVTTACKTAAAEFLRASQSRDYFPSSSFSMAEHVDYLRDIISQNYPGPFTEWNDFISRYESMMAVLKDKTISAISLWAAAVSSAKNYNFHSHAPGREKELRWYLTAPFSEISTVFLDVKDLSDPFSTANHEKHPTFITHRPKLWHGKPWSFYLFTAGNQPQGNAQHSFPCTEGIRLTVTIEFAERQALSTPAAEEPASLP